MLNLVKQNGGIVAEQSERSMKMDIKELKRIIDLFEFEYQEYKRTGSRLPMSTVNHYLKEIKKNLKN